MTQSADDRAKELRESDGADTSSVGTGSGDSGGDVTDGGSQRGYSPIIRKILDRLRTLEIKMTLILAAGGILLSGNFFFNYQQFGSVNSRIDALLGQFATLAVNVGSNLSQSASVIYGQAQGNRGGVFVATERIEGSDGRDVCHSILAMIDRGNPTVDLIERESAERSDCDMAPPLNDALRVVANQQGNLPTVTVGQLVESVLALGFWDDVIDQEERTLPEIDVPQEIDKDSSVLITAGDTSALRRELLRWYEDHEGDIVPPRRRSVQLTLPLDDLSTLTSVLHDLQKEVLEPLPAAN